MSVVETSSPHLRVSATNTSAKTQKQQQSTRIQAPEALVDDHFFWTYTEEPHRSRRQAIIKAHPEVTKLCGPEPLTKWVVLGVVSLQLTCAYLLRNTSMLDWRFLATAYVIGATCNQNLFLAIHEISHNLAFRSAFANRLLAIFANLPIGLPYSAAFRPYHLTHHKSLGVTGLDTDLPTAVEAFFLNSLLGKTFFCTFQILFYAVRPISFLAGSLHPCAGHFIAEHYFFSNVQNGGTESLSELKKGDNKSKTSRSTSTSHPLDSLPPPETYSYYGPLNILTYNVGLHNEHHDFPAIPWTRLHKLHEIASEFYEPLPCHRSWVWVIYTFILDKNVGPWCRVKREQGGRIVGGGKKGGSSAGSKQGNGRSGEGISAASTGPDDEEGDGWKESELQC
ncbi:hypothetical protein N7535_004572 [Penicillium sp. DV-2018c]|nr:hypothetical protein N7461_008152 [Penicillium sp. DV-2018c]KAJ5570912.1 hypothetical protein N7535_004572 [Penicillium sp. DV-2018c]